MYLDKFHQRFSEIGYLILKQIVPCTLKEVRSLENQLGFKLPEAYREFLQWGGHNAGRIMQDFDFSIECLIDIQEDAKYFLEEDESDLELPANAFVFLSHYNGWFMFFKVENCNEDPPVYAYGQYRDRNKKLREFPLAYPSYSNFLISCLEETAQLIKNRYKK
ncbi:hypothetical protein CKA32_006050 [Geitlerinema sp. FC II]|nr:SMI1/KNR4 family protein [Geitlerinema sp. CS-897]PPT07315.1 hypothetical protein CKA32_006050 [Geitlerinema sp. FC II]